MQVAWNEALIAFSSDLSGGDAAIASTVRDFIATPPTAPGAVGFVGTMDWPDRTRIYLATVSRLDERKFIRSIEDKYTWEIFGEWRRDGVIDPESLPAIAKSVFMPFATAQFSEDPEKQAAYRDLVWRDYAKATKQLEQQIEASGRRLMSVDATSGDTMFYALLAPDIAERWQNRAFSDHQGYRAGLRPFMWDRFWVHLRYSIGDVVAESSLTGMPPGTRLRDPMIPLIE
jgi:hypothetical protein